MFNFIKRLLGYPTDAEKAAAKTQTDAPYKVEAPVAETAPAVEVVTTVEEPKVEESKPAVITAKKKPAPKKQQFEKKPAAKKAGRKPKAKAEN